MYDDPPEPTEDEFEEAHARDRVGEKPIHITGLTTAHVDATIRGIIDGHYRISERIEEIAKKLVEKRVAAIADDVIRAKLEPIIEKVVADGFPVFDQFSGRETSRQSIRELVDKILTQRADGYSDDRGLTLVQSMVRKTVVQLFEGELKTTLKEAAASFKAQADTIFQAKIVASLKNAIGLQG